MPEVSSAKQIREYLKTRIDFLEACDTEIENKISNDLDSAVNLNLSDEDFTRCFFHLEHAVGCTFRYCMLIAVCSFLEEAHEAICQHSVAGYESKRGSSGKGSWLDRHRRMFVEHSILCIDEVCEQYDLMKDFVVIRNSLVHTWGNINKSKNSARLRQIIQNRGELLEEYGDGYLHLGDQVFPVAIEASERIVNHLSKHLLHASAC